MPNSALNMSIGILGILEATTVGPRTTEEILESLWGLGLEVTGPEIYPWLRRLTEDGLLTPSLFLDTSGLQVRHYWITREGVRQLEKVLPALRDLLAKGSKG